MTEARLTIPQAIISSMILAAISLCLIPQQLNPVFTPTSDQLLKCWQSGFNDAQKWKNSDGAWDQAKKGIGSINNKTVSFVWWMNPRLLAYDAGFQSRKQYLPEDSIAKLKDDLIATAQMIPKVITFRALITLMPRLNGPNNTVSRPADPADLDNVRCVLQVGDKIYQPIEQPGNVTPHRYQSANNYFIDQTTTETIRQSGQKDKVKTTTVKVPFTEQYDWYEGNFDVSFDLWNPDGSARITDKDTEFTVIVVQRFGENKATYKLADWLSKFEK